MQQDYLKQPSLFLSEVEKSFVNRTKPQKNEQLKIGLDLGTASIVLVVLGQDNRPLAAAREFAEVVRDGLVVDYAKAIQITTRLRRSLEEDLGVELTQTAIAVPPGTSDRDTSTHRNVAYGAGLEVTTVMDEPSAANLVLGVKNGAIVDIGGGTTGVAVLQDGKVIHTFDEPTGGTHVTLVIAGHYKVSFAEAEKIKTDPSKKQINLPVIAPVLQKMGTIIKEGLKNFAVEEIHLVGGTSSAVGIEKIISLETKCKAVASAVPILVTPSGIALSFEPTI
ncbi:MAG: ethanolamine utilization protein EutJ [Elusimicrobiota bacterium]|jgi:ethanolamine utilization protein EutJ|nr:ethanolamine utilization protein EutJ [Elusimicrobiota bacterium]